jgi:hypothetical protein
MVAFVGVAELTPVNAFDSTTVQLFSEFNERYQALINRTAWQSAENEARANRLATLKANTALSNSVALTSLSNAVINTELTRSTTLSTSVNNRLFETSDTSAIEQLEVRQEAVQTFLTNYTPQPFNSSLQQLATLQKIPGRLLGYLNNQWAYWSKSSSDAFEISAAAGTLERGQGANSNPGFPNNSYYPTPLNAETSDLKGDASVLDGISLPSKGLTILIGRQPLMADLAMSEIWNASLGGRMNNGSSHVGFVGSTNRSNLWTTETMAFAIGDYSNEGNFNYQMRARVFGGAPTAAMTGGTFQGAGGNESYNSLFALRFS